MKAYHEQLREESSKLILQRSTNHTFNPHFHINVELLIVKKGKTKIICNGTEHLLTDGMIAFFDSYDIHEYVTYPIDSTDDCLLVIPLKMLNNFNKIRKSGKIINPVFYDTELCDKLIYIIDTFLVNQTDNTIITSSVDLILSLINSKLQTAETNENNDGELIVKILDYANKNFRTNVSLSKVSAELGYCTAHLSRTFHKYLKMTLPEYVNNLRLDYVEKHKNDKGVLITKLIYDAGFKSIQSYYRNKKRIEE